MTRPALSASRSIDVLELLGNFPERGFTLSEIMRATKINVSSCHAVLAALTARGYLTRSVANRTYSLGPSLIAVGEAARKSQPIVARLEASAKALVADLRLPVLLSTVVGDEILAVLSLETSTGRDAGMHVGERLPLVAPVGAPFLAWSSEEVLTAWFARRATPLDPSHVAELRRDLELTRERGYHITLRSPRGPTIGALLTEMATSHRIAEYKGEVSRLIEAFDHHMCQPETIGDDTSYDVLQIAAPVFDRNGEAAYTLCLGGFPHRLSGDALKDHSDRLTRTCLEVMRGDRADARRQDAHPGTIVPVP